MPGRRSSAHAPRSRSARTGASCAALLFAALSLGCTSRGPQPDRALGSLWSEYRELPAERALAIAGELGRSHWVAGLSGGHASRAEAEAQALEACAERRQRLRIKDFCRLYAVNDEIVWGGGW